MEVLEFRAPTEQYKNQAEAFKQEFFDCEEKYDMEHLWNNGGRAWEYEYKYKSQKDYLMRIVLI